MFCKVHLIYEPGYVISYVGNLTEEKNPEFPTDS
jgi:hypothetical protein